MKTMHLHAWKRKLRHTVAFGAVLAVVLGVAPAFADGFDRARDHDRDQDTATPVRHVVVIIPENRTFDNYFGTYPKAANIPGEQSWVGVPAPKFVARDDTPG